MISCGSRPCGPPSRVHASRCMHSCTKIFPGHTWQCRIRGSSRGSRAGSLRAKAGPSRAACRLRDWRAALARGSFLPRSHASAYPPAGPWTLAKRTAQRSRLAVAARYRLAHSAGAPCCSLCGCHRALNAQHGDVSVASAGSGAAHELMWVTGLERGRTTTRGGFNEVWHLLHRP